MKRQAMMFLVLLGLALALGDDCPPECGWQANGWECPENQCCSKDGYCGLGPKYCDNTQDAGNCQSGACYDNKQCSKDTPCPNNQCCSGYGRCGHGIDYCGAGCQNGPCIADISCDKSNRCPHNLCCDKSGRCGLGGNYCGGGCQSGACYYYKCGEANGNAYCPNGYCCGSDGYCGLGKDYCTYGCQSHAGTCSSGDLFQKLICALQP